jgi:hypothetical protein
MDFFLLSRHHDFFEGRTPMDYRNIPDPHESEAKLIDCLARGKTVAVSAEISGLPESTIQCLQPQPDFKRKIAARRGEIIAETLGDLTSAAAEAAEKLRELAK